MKFALTVFGTCVAVVVASMNTSAAYQPIHLTVQTQLPQATQGTSFSYSFAKQVTGGTGPPYIWKLTGTLPSGFHFNTSTGLISGTLSATAKVSAYALKICAMGAKRAVTGAAAGNTACVSTKIAVVKATPTPKPSSTPTSTLRVTTTQLPAAISGQRYNATIAVLGVVGTLTCTLHAGSSLPVGYAIVPNTCVINGTGAILSSGTTQTISPPFTITVTDSAFPLTSVNATFTLTTYIPSPVIAMIPAICPALVRCNVVVATATGGTPPYHFESSQFAGGLPPLGMTVDINGALTGTPQQQGVFNFGVCAIDSVARQGCNTTTVTVTVPPTFRITVNKNGDGQGVVNADSGLINCGPVCQDDYILGTRVTLTANPTGGSSFSNWAGACAGAGTCVVVVNAAANVTATFTLSASGTYSGNINFPNIQPAGYTGSCGAQVIYRSITLQESQGGKIVGNINNGATIAGTRVGNVINVQLQTVGGPRGPYAWQWNGATLTGTLPALCTDNATGAVLTESSYQFNLQKG